MNCVGCGLCVSECMANQTAKKMGTDKYALTMVEAKGQFAEQAGADYLYYHCSPKGDIFPTSTVKGVSFKMIGVEGGTFQMGSNDGFDYEKP